ncbi:MAG: hypothetical protein U1E76_05480 [Planctomycetota bacterium]
MARPLIALAIAFVRTRLTPLPVLLLLGAVLGAHALGASFSGLTGVETVRGDIAQRLLLLEVASVALTIAQAAFARSRDASTRHLNLVLATPVERPVVALGWLGGAIAFGVLVFSVASAIALLPIDWQRGGAALGEVLPRRVLLPESSNVGGDGAQVLRVGAVLRAAFPPQPATAIRISYHTFGGLHEQPAVELRVAIEAASGTQVVERALELEGPVSLALPHELQSGSAPIEITVSLGAGSPPIILSPRDVVLIGARYSILAVVAAMMLSFALLCVLPAALAVTLGMFVRGGLAFLLTFGLTVAASFAPFFRDAARYLEEPGRAGVPWLPVRGLGAIARVVTRAVPDLSCLRPSVLWESFPWSEQALRVLPWAAAAVLLAGASALVMRREADS